MATSLNWSQLANYFVPEAEDFYQHRLHNKNPETALLRKPGVFTDSRRFDAPEETLEKPQPKTTIPSLWCDEGTFEANMQIPQLFETETYVPELFESDNFGLDDTNVGDLRNWKENTYTISPSADLDTKHGKYRLYRPEGAYNHGLLYFPKNLEEHERGTKLGEATNRIDLIKVAKDHHNKMTKETHDSQYFQVPQLFQDYQEQTMRNVMKENGPNEAGYQMGSDLRQTPQMPQPPKLTFKDGKFVNNEQQEYNILERCWKDLKAPVAPAGLPKEDPFLDLELMPPNTTPLPPNEQSQDPNQAPNNEDEAAINAAKALTPTTPISPDPQIPPSNKIQDIIVSPGVDGLPVQKEVRPLVDPTGNYDALSKKSGLRHAFDALLSAFGWKKDNFANDISIPNTLVPRALQTNVNTEIPQLQENRIPIGEPTIRLEAIADPMPKDEKVIPEPKDPAEKDKFWTEVDFTTENETAEKGKKVVKTTGKIKIANLDKGPSINFTAEAIPKVADGYTRQVQSAYQDLDGLGFTFCVVDVEK